MKTAPNIKITDDGSEVATATARLLLQHAHEKGKQNGCDEDPDLARKRAMNELTGASIFLPPKVVSLPVEESVSQVKVTTLNEGLSDKKHTNPPSKKLLHDPDGGHLVTAEIRVTPLVEVVTTGGFAEVQCNETLLKSGLLSNMSHELRAPLNTILGFAQLMESDSPPPTPSQKASIDQILRSGWYLMELINEILDLAVIESGRLSLSLEPVSLDEVMSECQATIEPRARKRGISVIFPEFEKPCFIKADRARVKQVFINLLSNAIKYNQAGGTVVVAYAIDTQDRIRISVRDTGEGLSPENLKQLFQPFNRLGQETSGEKGLGIGLVVSKRLVELMQGMIGVESTVGKGSVFWIDLPSDVDPHLKFKKAESATVETAQRPHLLLYVEDHPENRKLMEQLIARRPDMRIMTAKNGNEGIALAGAYLPDVILMDINMPGINGVEAMKIIRRNPATAHIPIIALSANAIPRDIEKGLEEGFFRYLTKPIKFNEFIETLSVAFRWGLHPHQKKSRE